jgi:hypothetical protein
LTAAQIPKGRVPQQKIGGRREAGTIYLWFWIPILVHQIQTGSVILGQGGIDAGCIPGLTANTRPAVSELGKHMHMQVGVATQSRRRAFRTSRKG